ncbi:hypothetical protein ACEZCY_13985 [Streptacidiphilus sp. N1-12]|uniref:Uncharacterized protein n=2 Tax=Streptacidiphilus alkalitolerans TaxID=3342712 RepID=A0ABV6V9G1_9ACTN
MRRTRQFTIAELEALGMPNNLPKGMVIMDRIVSTGRLHEKHQLVFRLEGVVWSVYYAVAVHGSAVPPFREDPVTATAMELRTVAVRRWRPIEFVPEATS